MRAASTCLVDTTWGSRAFFGWHSLHCPTPQHTLLDPIVASRSRRPHTLPASLARSQCPLPYTPPASLQAVQQPERNVECDAAPGSGQLPAAQLPHGLTAPRAAEGACSCLTRPSIHQDSPMPCKGPLQVLLYLASKHSPSALTTPPHCPLNARLPAGSDQPSPHLCLRANRLCTLFVRHTESGSVPCVLLQHV